jgi:hypothetical protein
MKIDQIWTGQEVQQLQQFSDMLTLAGRLVGRDDHLANLMLEDALETLHGVMGDRARAVSELRDVTRRTDTTGLDQSRRPRPRPFDAGRRGC